MRTWKYAVLLMVCFAVAGCALMEPKTNDSGQVYTDLENYFKTAGNVLTGVGAFIPGWGTLAAGLGGLLSVIGGSITSVAMVRKRGKTLDTVIKGVEVASETFDEVKTQLLSSLKVLLKDEDYKKAEEMLTKATSIKEIIKKIADIVGTESYLHTRVKAIG